MPIEISESIESPDSIHQIVPIDDSTERNEDLLRLASKIHSLEPIADLRNGALAPRKKVDLDLFDPTNKTKQSSPSLQERKVEELTSLDNVGMEFFKQSNPTQERGSTDPTDTKDRSTIFDPPKQTELSSQTVEEEREELPNLSNIGMDLFHLLTSYYDLKQEKVEKLAEKSESLLLQIQDLNKIESLAIKNREGIDPEKNPVHKAILDAAKKTGLVEESKTKLTKEDIERFIKDCEEQKEIHSKNSDLASSKISPLLNLLQTIINILQSVLDSIKQCNRHIVQKTGNH